MKKMILITLSLLLVLCTLTATEATLIPSTLKRKTNIKKVTTNHPIIAGVSPTTGLPTTNTFYIPIISQIDNNLEAIPQWGISFADIMYEFPIQGQGWTRLTALFSDKYPQEAGPVRSGRVMHADLREEWDAVFVFYGKQEAPGSNLKETLIKYGVTSKNLAIDGIGNKYQEYFSRVRYHAAPHNVTAYIANIQDMVKKQDYQFPVRPFLFTDETNYAGQEAIQFSVIHKGNKDSSSTFVFDEQRNGYHRFTQQGAYFDYLNPTEVLSFSNVIIQRTKLTFNNSSMNPLLPDVVGSGAADIFVAGRYIAGMWTRDKVTSRTVFYDQNGSEISLQRGKSWIIICDESTNIAIGEIDKSSQGGIFIPLSEDENGKMVAASEKPVVPSAPSEKTNNSDGLIVVSDSTNENDQKEIATVRVKNNSTLNMRKKPSEKSDIILRIPNGSQVMILEKEDKWSNISYKEIVGYVMTAFLDF